MFFEEKKTSPPRSNAWGRAQSFLPEGRLLVDFWSKLCLFVRIVLLTWGCYWIMLGYIGRHFNNLKELVLTTVIFAPGACWTGPVCPISAGAGDAGDDAGEFREAMF